MTPARIERIAPRSTALAQSLSATLGDLLQNPFQVWVRHGLQWEPWRVCDAAATSSVSSQTGSFSPWLEQHFVPTEATVETLDEEQLIVIVPVKGHDRTTLAVVGTTTCRDLTLVRNLANTLLASHEQKHDLELANARLAEYAVQVGTDFEELTWLRNLAEHIELCDLNNDIANVATATLPSLRELIRAETILLFGMPESKAGQDTASAAGTLCYRGGGESISEHTARQLIDRLQHVSVARPAVRNAVSREHSIPEVEGVRNCILIRVLKSGFQSGWLLAVNKEPLAADGKGTPISASSLSDWEFGTFEASLLNAAAVMLGTHGRNVALFAEKETLLTGVIRALINAIDAKDAYTFGHSDRVAAMSKRMALELGLAEKECERLYMAGLLHDIGKIGVPDRVLGKPDKLTDDEFALIKAHPEIGVEILKHLEPLGYVLPGVLYHHETFDGRGYPQGLSGDAIPLSGRIIAVADAYDAMTSDRPYRKGMPTEKAEAILRSGAAKQWDAKVLDAFFAAINDMYAICGMGSHRAAEQALPAENAFAGGIPRLDVVVSAISSAAAV